MLLGRLAREVYQYILMFRAGAKLSKVLIKVGHRLVMKEIVGAIDG